MGSGGEVNVHAGSIPCSVREFAVTVPRRVDELPTCISYTCTVTYTTADGTVVTGTVQSTHLGVGPHAFGAYYSYSLQLQLLVHALHGAWRMSNRSV